MVLRPSDEISVVGTEAQLSQFASKVEVPLSPVDREEATMQKFSVGEHSVLIGMTVSQFGMMCRGACLIIGIERSDGSYVRPLGLVRFQPYDMVWIAGDRETIEPGARRNEASRTENGKKARTADSPQEMILSIRCQLKGILFFISPV